MSARTSNAARCDTLIVGLLHSSQNACCVYGSTRSRLASDTAASNAKSKR